MSLELVKSLDENLKNIKDELVDNSDLVYREIIIGSKLKAALVMVDGLSQMAFVSDFVIENLLGELEDKDIEENDDNLLDFLIRKSFSSSISTSIR